MASKPRKQTVKLFLKRNRDPKNYGKIYMALILSNSAFWKLNPNCEQRVDDLIGDHFYIERFGRKNWKQRNAFLFRGYPYRLRRAIKRLKSVPLKIENIDQPNIQTLISLHVPITQDKLCLFIDESRTLSRRLAGPLRIAFRSKDPAKMKCFDTACRIVMKIPKKIDLFNFWTDQTEQGQLIIANIARRGVVSFLLDQMKKGGHPIDAEVILERSFQELIHAHALYWK